MPVLLESLEYFDSDLYPILPNRELDDVVMDTCAPSEDIWKKFGLATVPFEGIMDWPQTPPMSPSRDVEWDVPCCDEQIMGNDKPMKDIELKKCAAFINMESCEDFMLYSSELVKSAVLRNDCMWSGPYHEETHRSTTADLNPTEPKSTPVRGRSDSKGSRCISPLRSSTPGRSPSPMPLVGLNLSQCASVCPDSTIVTPSSEVPSCGNGSSPTPNVFPYPLSDHSYHASKQMPECNKDSLGIQTPSDSEEEIDVVACDESSTFSQPKPPSVLKRNVQTLPNNTQLHRQLHMAVSIAAKSAANTTRRGVKRVIRTHYEAQQPSTKRSRIVTKITRKVEVIEDVDDEYEQVSRTHKEIVTRDSRKCSSRSSSDSEDCDRRREHNDLERKRRNDLKSSFQTLRKEIPELVHNDRAPKVLILTKAKDYICSLKYKSTSLDDEFKILTKRKKELEKKLASLNRRK